MFFPKNPGTTCAEIYKKNSRQEIREWYNLHLLPRGPGLVSSVKFVFLLFSGLINSDFGRSYLKLIKAMDAPNGGVRLKIEA